MKYSLKINRKLMKTNKIKNFNFFILYILQRFLGL